VISYSFLVTNTGNVSLTGPVTIDDDKATNEVCPAVTTVGNLDAELDPGEAITCTASYTVTQADLNAGSVTNVATASADGTTSNQDTATANADQNPALGIVKEADPTTYDSVGDVINYTITATNTGNVTLHNVTVTDETGIDNFACDPTVPAASLAPGGTIECTGTHTITQADLDAGEFLNVACVDDGAGGATEACDDATVDAVARPAFTITKVANPTTYDSVGDEIDYTITFTNTGNVTLHNVDVADETGIDGFACTPTVPAASVAPAGTIVCTGSHTITQADLDAGTFANTACAVSDEVPEACDTATVTGTSNPGISIDKSSTTTTITAAGQVVPYTYLVSNTGNVTLTGITVTDDKVASVSCPATTLAVGASMTCTGSHTVTAAEFAAGGNLTNLATADSTQTDPVTDTHSIPIAPPTVVAQITPTATTCQAFASGTAATLEELLYSVKGNPPKIAQVAPGVFFYWVKVSGGGTYTITQSSTPTFKPFSIASGSAVWNANCSKVGSATISQNTTTGAVTVTFSGTGTFYIGLKYDSGSVKGELQPSPTTVHYTFGTSGVAGSTQGLDLKKK
jgi:hypothetical protein